MAVSKNKALNALPRFIWGEAVSESGFDNQQYLTHTQYPRFICRVYEGEDIETSLEHGAGFDSAASLHPRTGEPIYVTSLDVHFKDFVWFDKPAPPPPEAVKKACDDAIRNYLMRDDELGINDDG